MCASISEVSVYSNLDAGDLDVLEEYFMWLSWNQLALTTIFKDAHGTLYKLWADYKLEDIALILRKLMVLWFLKHHHDLGKGQTSQDLRYICLSYKFIFLQVHFLN